MEQQDKIAFFLELTECSCCLDYWRYSPDGILLFSTSAAEHMLEVLLRETGCLDYMRRNIGNVPIILAAKHGIRWIAVKEEKNGELIAYHVLGPFLLNALQDGYDAGDIHTKNINMYQIWKERLRGVLETLSVLPIQNYTQYAVMFYKVITGETVAETAINHQPPPAESLLAGSISSDNARIKDRMNIYLTERTLLHAVQEGDEDSAVSASLQLRGKALSIRKYTGNSLLDYQIACTTFTAVCVRAAIEGGLSPSVAYPLGDMYIRKTFQATNYDHITEIRNDMYHSFISHVHALRVNPNYSKAVQSCCDYIQLHAVEELSIDILADRLGYSKYYLSSLFRKETGCTVGDYIKYTRIERAKVLLASTSMNVEDIWENVGFSSRSVFGKAFRTVVGMTPREYRDQNIRL